jgi:hypothetical protein
VAREVCERAPPPAVRAWGAGTDDPGSLLRMGGRLVAGAVMRRRKVWRDLAAATLLVAGGVLCWGVGVVYGMAAEYGRDVSGDSVGSGLGQAVTGGLLIGLLA